LRRRRIAGLASGAPLLVLQQKLEFLSGEIVDPSFQLLGGLNGFADAWGERLGDVDQGAFPLVPGSEIQGNMFVALLTATALFATRACHFDERSA
jgi:hypothetical protein